MIAKATAESSARAAAAEARAELETERRRDMETRVQSAAAPPAPPERPPISREEMQAGVDAGTITQIQMDAELERQLEARVEQRVASKQEIKQRGSKIGSQIDEYLARVPDIDDPTSDNHKRVRAEFAALRKLEYPNDATTELAALRAVLGPIENVRIPEVGNTTREVDTTTHAGAGGEKSGEKAPAGPGPIKGVAGHFVEYWTEGIKAGRYSGWDDPVLQDVMKREAGRAKR
jgi:hypothetical protein